MAKKRTTKKPIDFGRDKRPLHLPGALQHALFCYLKPAQQAHVRPMLRMFTPKQQDDLCVALLDYMESGVPSLPHESRARACFLCLTRLGMPHNDIVQERVIRPLTSPFV